MSDKQGTAKILFSEFTAPLSAGGPRELPRQSVEFELILEELPADVQAALLKHEPDKQTITIKLLSPTSAQELEAVRAAQSDMLRYATVLALSTIHTIDGSTVSTTEREMFWELIGPRARNVITQQFTPLIAPSDQALGKALETLKVG